MTFAFAAAVLSVVTCGGLIIAERREAETNATILLEAAHRKVKREFTLPVSSGILGELVDDERDLTGATFAVSVLDTNGRVMEKSQKLVPNLPDWDRKQWRVETVSLEGGTVVLGLPWRVTHDALDRQAAMLVVLSGVFFVAVTVGTWLVVGRTLSPIGSLTRQAQAASGDSLRIRLYPSSQDAEIVGLVNTLNALLDRLTEQAAARGRFYAAASHELRTPLQALSGHLELALTRPRTAEEYEAVVQEANGQTVRLTTLVHDLLLLNRLDSAPPPVAEPVFPAVICERALHQFAPLIEARHLRVETDWHEAAELLAPPTHCEMLARNLIENAVKYASQGGTVRVAISADGAAWEIFNTCAAQPEWDGAKLFEPFYRPDASRNSRTGGNGLGLAICKAIADANGWAIALEQVPGGVSAKVNLSIPK